MKILHLIFRTGCFGGTVILLAACAAGPTYRRPAVDTPPFFKEAGTWKPATPADQLPRGAWWQVFHDPVLDGLENKLEISNNTLAGAAAQLRQAQAAVQETRSALFPSLGASISANRERSAARDDSTAKTVKASASAGLSAAWEPDLWGRVRRAEEGGRALVSASAADLESAKLSLHATLAQTYFAVRTVDAERDLLERLTGQYEDFLAVTQNRYRQGVAARADVASAETQLKTIQAQQIDLGATRAQLEHSLALLLGQPPATFSLSPASLPAELPTAPVVLPSTLLERRPDIAASERRLAAASAQIGVAKSGFFPTLSLTGAIGIEPTHLAELFSAPGQVWAVGASLAESIFDGGKVRAQVQQARGAYDESLSNYRQTVLTAFQEVEDGLANVRILGQEADVQEQAVAAAKETLVLTENQYKAGTVSHLNVITAQAALLDAERTAVTLSGRRFDSMTQLFKATGGAWRVEES